MRDKSPRGGMVHLFYIPIVTYAETEGNGYVFAHREHDPAGHVTDRCAKGAKPAGSSPV